MKEKSLKNKMIRTFKMEKRKNERKKIKNKRIKTFEMEKSYFKDFLLKEDKRDVCLFVLFSPFFVPFLSFSLCWLQRFAPSQKHHTLIFFFV